MFRAMRPTRASRKFRTNAANAASVPCDDTSVIASERLVTDMLAVRPANDTGAQRRTREGAKRPTRPSVCNAGLGSLPARAREEAHLEAYQQEAAQHSDDDCRCLPPPSQVL